MLSSYNDVFESLCELSLIRSDIERSRKNIINGYLNFGFSLEDALDKWTRDYLEINNAYEQTKKYLKEAIR